MTVKTETVEAGAATGHPAMNVRTFQVRADSFRDSDNSFEAVIATENPVMVYDFMSGEVVDEILLMNGAQMPESRQVPLLDTHSRWSIDNQKGSTREIRVEGAVMAGRLYISSVETETTSKVREGHVTDCSVGYGVKAKVRIEAGESAEVSGKTYSAGARALHIVTAWQLYENSLCPIGADSEAKIRAAAVDGHLIRRLESMISQEEGDMEQDTGKKEDREKEGAETRTEAGAGTKITSAKPANADVERAEAIRAIAPRGLESFADALVLDTEITVDEARKRFLAELAKKTEPAGTPHAQTGEEGEKTKERGIEDLSDGEMTRSITG